MMMARVMDTGLNRAINRVKQRPEETDTFSLNEFQERKMKRGTRKRQRARARARAPVTFIVNGET